MQVVLTVPAMWSHKAKDKTLKAAKAAAIPGEIKMVTEPEAAALATLKDKAEAKTLKVSPKGKLLESLSLRSRLLKRLLS